MASNPIPNNNGQFISMAHGMLGGLASLGVPLGITQITPAGFQSQMAAFVDADNGFNTARSDRQKASYIYHSASDALAFWLGVVRNVLAGRFGNRWSTVWVQAGFINATTRVPRRMADQLMLGQQLVNFFTQNPGYEVPGMNVTAAHGSALCHTVNTTQQVLLGLMATLKTAKDADATTRKELVVTMRLLMHILQARLGRDDPRWHSFGLNVPAADTTPGQPVNVAAVPDQAGNIVVTCDAVPQATRYRWRMLLAGVDHKYSLAASTVAPLGIITGVQPGQTLIIVQAVNGNQQGVASESILFTVPTVFARLSMGVPEAKASGANGHPEGNGNGHAALSRVP